MVYCVNCGYPLDGVKFCPKCGTPAEELKEEFKDQIPPVQPETPIQSTPPAQPATPIQSIPPVQSKSPVQPMPPIQPTPTMQSTSPFPPTPPTGQTNSGDGYKHIPYTPKRSGGGIPWDEIDNYGQFIGIGLLVICFFASASAPSFISFLIAACVLAGAIICLKRKYKLYGFNIAAIILACICLIVNISRVGSDLMWELGDTKDDIADIIEDHTSEDTKSYSFDDYKPQKEEAADDTTDYGYSSDDKSSQEDEQEESTFKDTVESAVVDPDLKAFLDEYEAFMDKYIDFMKSYNSSADITSLMPQYLEIMDEYYKYMEAVDKYDSNTMSSADAAYYLEVTNRVNKKMMDALY